MFNIYLHNSTSALFLYIWKVYLSWLNGTFFRFRSKDNVKQILQQQAYRDKDAVTDQLVREPGPDAHDNCLKLHIIVWWCSAYISLIYLGIIHRLIFSIILQQKREPWMSSSKSSLENLVCNPFHLSPSFRYGIQYTVSSILPQVLCLNSFIHQPRFLVRVSELLHCSFWHSKQ